MIAVGGGAQHRGVQIARKADGLTIHGIGQHHSGGCRDSGVEHGTVALYQGQSTQGICIAHGATQEDRAVGACVQGHGTGRHGIAVQGFCKGDVGTCSEATVVGRIKCCVSSDHGIVSDVDGVGAAGAHQATTEGAATCSIGLKVRRCRRATNCTAVGGGAAVSDHDARGAVERAAKCHASTCECGGVGGRAAHRDGAVVGLGVDA